MKTNQGVIVLAERAADHSIIRAVLTEWGYRDSEIQDLLKEPKTDQQLETRHNATEEHSGKSYYPSTPVPMR